MIKIQDLVEINFDVIRSTLIERNQRNYSAQRNQKNTRWNAAKDMFTRVLPRTIVTRVNLHFFRCKSRSR